MERHGIQVNKTTRNSVLFMTNIGTTRSSVAHLIDALVDLATAFEETTEDESATEKRARERAVLNFTEKLPPLPDFSAFHVRFRRGETPEGDMRTAYFLGTEEDNCEYCRIDETEIDALMAAGRELVASSFLTPYPPGFPILVPGQVVSVEILSYLRQLDTKEIHGYRADLGIRVFTVGALESTTCAPPACLPSFVTCSPECAPSSPPIPPRPTRTSPLRVPRSIPPLLHPRYAKNPPPRPLRHPPLLPPQRDPHLFHQRHQLQPARSRRVGARLPVHQPHRLLRWPSPQRLRAAGNSARSV
ncbi:MAG: hypothetical protein J6386_02875 [Candidatus Synoicihabitans palmerolidicus]|nr:hypothetical protein [Candidatus Synoicihabitans palmerolidicus]